jgi:hypothetical protein
MATQPSLVVPHIVVRFSPGHRCRTHRPQENDHSPSATPVLVALGGTVNNKLSRHAGVHCGHETLLDTIRVVDDLGQRRAKILMLSRALPAGQPVSRGVYGGVGDDGARELAVDEVILHDAARVVKGEEGVVDGHGHDVGVVLDGGMADEAAAAAETLYSNLDSRG